MKRVLPLLLALSLALPLPAWGMEPSGKSYEEALEQCRNGFGYYNERAFETGECTILVNDYGGMMYPHTGVMRVIYKAGSTMGEGTVITLPYPRRTVLVTCSPADTMELSEDGKTFTYSYYLNDSLTSPDNGKMVRGPGLYLYTVALATGEVEERVEELTFENTLFTLTNAQGYTTEKRLDAPGAAVVLRWKNRFSSGPQLRDYELYLIRKEGQPVAQRLLLPSTAFLFDYYAPTDCAPDQLTLSEDGTTLTYIYHFGEALFNADGAMLHDAGSYTYRVDVSTGELTVELKKGTDPEEQENIFSSSPGIGAEGTTFVDISPEDWFFPYVKVCVEKELMKGVGDGRFDPQGTVTRAEIATIAARLHHIQKGGDGNLPAAPGDWGTLTVEFENGNLLTFDGSHFVTFPSPMSFGWGAKVDQEQLSRIDWLEVGEWTPVTVSAELGEKMGPYHVRACWNGSDKTLLRFKPDPENTPEEERAGFANMERQLVLVQRPAVGNWFRDVKYYLESAGLTKHSVFNPDTPQDTATRENFALALGYVSEGLLEPINQITDYPDSTPYDQELKDQVLALYNAGILTGKDEFGAFDSEGTLTRAECAAMAARGAEPSLRLKFQPTPTPEKYRYELTYLMDDPMEGHEVTGPVLPLFDYKGDYGGILTLDGTMIPWPYGEKPVAMLFNGYYNGLYMSFWAPQPDGSKVEVGGVMDESGKFVVPLTAGCYQGCPLKDGRYITLSGTYGGTATLWDKDGSTTDLGFMGYGELMAQYPLAPEERGLPIKTLGGWYVDSNRHPVSEGFDWVGGLTADGRGFVGKGGKIYRIQFAEI